MGFRFQKRIKIAPGVRLNISKSGISTSLGVNGATVNIGKDGVQRTIGIPGTGLSHRKRILKSSEAPPPDTKAQPSKLAQVAAGLFVAAIMYGVFKLTL